MSTVNIFDLTKIHKEYFGKNPYYIDKNGSKTKLTQENEFPEILKNPHPKGKIHKSRFNQDFNKIGSYGQNIWFPIKLTSIDISTKPPTEIVLEVVICTVAIKLLTNIVSTPISNAEPNPKDNEGNRLEKHNKGCVNEIINYEDTKFAVRGILVGKNRKVPENEISKLKYFAETEQSVELKGGYVELFLDATCRIQMTNLEFPEVQGQNYWIRPFSFDCESDFITDLKF